VKLKSGYSCNVSYRIVSTSKIPFTKSWISQKFGFHKNLLNLVLSYI